MFVFCIEYPGVWLGATAVVVAEDQKQAILLLRQQIKQDNQKVLDRYNNPILSGAIDTLQGNMADEISDDEFKIVRTMSMNAPAVFISDNGDY